MLVVKILVRLLTTVLLYSSAVFCFAGGRIVLVVDDLGNQRGSGYEAIDIPWITTVAIMPGRPFTKELAEYANQLNKEIIIHAPMSNTTDFPLGPLGLDRRDGKAQLLENLRAAIENVPHAVGLSNHMGSRLTQDYEAMTWVMAELSRQSFYFFDSRTVATTIGWEVAEQYHVPWSMRNIFLDHYQTTEFIDSQWHKAIRRAQNGETVTVICHPYPETLAYLSTVQVANDVAELLVPLSSVLKGSIFVKRLEHNFPKGA